MIFAWRAASHWELDADEDNVLVRNPRAAIGDINPDEINAMGDFIVKGSLQREKSDPIELPGSVTIEQVLWAGAVIVIVGIVVAAIKFFVTSESAKIK